MLQENRKAEMLKTEKDLVSFLERKESHADNDDISIHFYYQALINPCTVKYSLEIGYMDSSLTFSRGLRRNLVGH